MQITLAGHSFIRRLRDHVMVSGSPTSRENNTRPHDITPGHPSHAAAAVRGLRLDHHFEAVHTVSDNIIFIADIITARHIIIHSRPTVLVVDIGSNDIARFDSVKPREMLNLAHTLHLELIRIAAPLTIINAVLPRDAGIVSTPAVFRENAHIFNQIIAELSTLCHNVIFNKLRGFQHHHINGHDVPRPVTEWSSDGIHCSPSALPTYAQRIRHAILDNCHRIPAGHSH